MPSNSPSRILRLRGVLERTGLSRSTLYRNVRSGTFPKPLRISTRCTGWRECDVEMWLRNPEAYPLTRKRREIVDRRSAHSAAATLLEYL